MSELLNLVGLSTGVVPYAMLLAMVLRAGRHPQLCLRRELAEYGGTAPMSIESESGIGTAVEIRLPVAVPTTTQNSPVAV